MNRSPCPAPSYVQVMVKGQACCQSTRGERLGDAEAVWDWGLRARDP